MKGGTEKCRMLELRKYVVVDMVSGDFVEYSDWWNVEKKAWATDRDILEASVKMAGETVEMLDKLARGVQENG